MKQIVVNVPDNKMQAFEEAMSALGFETKVTSTPDIPEWHKKIVLERIANGNPEDSMDWDDAINKIQFNR